MPRPLVNVPPSPARPIFPLANVAAALVPYHLHPYPRKASQAASALYILRKRRAPIMYAHAFLLLLLLFQWTNLAVTAPHKPKLASNVPTELALPPSPELLGLPSPDQNFRPLFTRGRLPIRNSPYLWLVVPQTMDMIHTQGGVLPQGTTETSIYQHMHGNKNSVYVTVYESIHAARMAYASVAATGIAGTLLCIHEAKNAIELTESVPQTENLQNYERGFVLLGGAWDAQIKKSALIESGVVYNEDEIEFVDNKNYDLHYYQQCYSFARPRLAGLPSNHPELADTELKFSNSLECDAEARAFMDSIAEAVGWRKEWPLVLPPSEAAIATEAVMAARSIICDASKAVLEARRADDLVAARRALATAQNALATVKLQLTKIGYIVHYTGSLPRSTFDSPWSELIYCSKVTAGIEGKVMLLEAAQFNQNVLFFSTHVKNAADDSQIMKEIKDAASQIEEITNTMQKRIKATENQRSEIIGAKSKQFEDIKPEIWLGKRLERKSEAIERDIHLLDELIILQTHFYKDLVELVHSAKNAIINLEAKRSKEMEQKTKEQTEKPKEVSDAEKRKNTAIEQAQRIQDNPKLNPWYKRALSKVTDLVGLKWDNVDTTVALAVTGTAAAGVGGKIAVSTAKVGAGTGSSTSSLGITAAKNIQTVNNVELGNAAKGKTKDNSQVTADSEQVDASDLESLLDSSVVDSPIVDGPVVDGSVVDSSVRNSLVGFVNEGFEGFEAGPAYDVLLEQLQNLPVASGHPALQAASESLAQSASGSLANPASGAGSSLLKSIKATPSRIKVKLHGNKYERLAEKRRRSIVRRDNGQINNQELQHLLDQDSASVAIRAMIRAMLVGLQYASDIMAHNVTATI
ncbi:hypothetical protein DCS_02481 [Drechmeria coniospora]|uniref:Uncharacterized protein n=1 Tax=Drechmeria coniospora TaxID=98403 RepID=A0A151GW60_DRECN|nr:hypothetical protein DCS_02481 [Drechmeria coniospora]KYK61339.1 hypothetical protein DCS_02481 [Drechmeria coniospora]